MEVALSSATTLRQQWTHKRCWWLATGLTQAPNDKQQIKPMLGTLAEQVRKLGAVQTLIADTGYCSEKNILACEEAKITPLIAVAREDHHPHWRERFTEPAPLPEGATLLQTMLHQLNTLAGKAAYAVRKQTVEPVFGIIKSVMGFRQFSCLLYTSPSPRDRQKSRMPSSA